VGGGGEKKGGDADDTCFAHIPSGLLAILDSSWKIREMNNMISSYRAEFIQTTPTYYAPAL
jgi:hypothetical protein